MINETASLNKCLTIAFRVGCERDQMARFLSAGYVPQPKQMEFNAAARSDVELIGYGGTRGQAKSHAVLAQVGLDDCQRVPGLKWLYLRKIQKSAGEQFEDLVAKVLRGAGARLLKGVLKFDNGSRIIVGGYRSENEIDGYIGVEYDGIVIEDATTLAKSKIDRIRGSLRTSREDWQPKLYATANPGGVGHQWFKEMFVDPWMRGKEITTRFIHTTMGDNIFINKSYEDYLNALTGWLRRAWRDGDFSIAAGQFFTTFDEQVHVIPPMRLDPLGNYWWAVMDYGRVHWNITYLLCQVGETVYVVDEHASRRQLIPQNAEGIKAMLARHANPPLRTFVAGQDVFATRHTEMTIAEEYHQHGITLSPAKMDRISRASRVVELLGNPNPQEGEAHIEPRLRIFDRCEKLIRCLPVMQHDPNRGEDVLKVDTDPDTGEGGDDPYDALGMGLMETAGRYGAGANPFANYRG